MAQLLRWVTQFAIRTSASCSKLPAVNGVERSPRQNNVHYLQVGQSFDTMHGCRHTGMNEDFAFTGRVQAQETKEETALLASRQRYAQRLARFPAQVSKKESPGCAPASAGGMAPPRGCRRKNSAARSPAASARLSASFAPAGAGESGAPRSGVSEPSIPVDAAASPSICRLRRAQPGRVQESWRKRRPPTPCASTADLSGRVASVLKAWEPPWAAGRRAGRAQAAPQGKGFSRAGSSGHKAQGAACRTAGAHAGRRGPAQNRGSMSGQFQPWKCGALGCLQEGTRQLALATTIHLAIIFPVAKQARACNQLATLRYVTGGAAGVAFSAFLAHSGRG